MAQIQTQTRIDIDDNYVILGQISKSNNSDVYLLRSENNFYILKVGFSPKQELVELICKEADALDQLEDYGGIKLIDSPREDLNKNEKPWLIMDYIPGINLFDLLQSLRGSGNKPAYELKLLMKYKLIYEIAQELNAIHKKNLVHRDIKPGNIFIDPNFHPHIGDFGDLTDQSKYKFTERMHGTLNFIPPEGFPNSDSKFPISEKFDVYSFGGTLLQIITYEWPHSDIKVKDDSEKSFYNIIKDIVTNPETQLDKRFEEGGPLHSQLLPIDSQLYEIYKLCCSFSPEERPTMSEVLHLIKESAESSMDPETFHSFIKWTKKIRTCDDDDDEEEEEDDEENEEEEEEEEENEEDEGDDEYVGTVKNVKKAIRQGFHRFKKSAALAIAARSCGIEIESSISDQNNIITTLNETSSLLPSQRPECDHDYSFSDSFD